MVVDLIVMLGLPLWLGVEELMRLRSEWSAAGKRVEEADADDGRYGRRWETATRTAGRARCAVR